MSLTKRQKKQLEEKWRTKLDFVMADDILDFDEDSDTLLHIRQGSGSYMTKEMKQEGYVSYAKMTEYSIEEDKPVLNHVEVLLLKEPYHLIRDTDKAWLIRACRAKLRETDSESNE